ncbi:MAG: OmpA family protein [Saprospiraceae bacterium]
MNKLYIVISLLFLWMSARSQEDKIQFTPLPPEINTTDSEEFGRWTIDGKGILFTRLGKTQQDLMMARIDSIGHVVDVEKLDFKGNYKGGGLTISPDGQSLILTVCGDRFGSGSCDLYISEFKDGAWTAQRNMGPAFNGPSWEGQPAYGLDGLSIYFASTRPGGYGGSDIWMVRQISPGIWSNPINLGAGVNTANNEGSPFIHFDGQTMYFMRDGIDGYGGYDLYFSHLGTDGKWKLAENMGPSINTAADEGGLSVHPDGKKAMITRSTPDKQNDLFLFNIPPKFQSLPIQALYVYVKDETTGVPLRAKIDLLEQDGKDTIRIPQQPDEKGKVIITLEQNKSYGLIATLRGYMMNSTNLKPTKETARVLNLQMIPIASAANKTIKLQNINFDSGSATLLASSTAELRILLQTMQSNPGMKIEIHGYTDNEGSEAENLRLSEARAETVYAYLTRNGIDKSRLSHKGFGNTKPVAGNETEDGKRQNRRTEFLIIKI